MIPSELFYRRIGQVQQTSHPVYDEALDTILDILDALEERVENLEKDGN